MDIKKAISEILTAKIYMRAAVFSAKDKEIFRKAIYILIKKNEKAFPFAITLGLVIPALTCLKVDYLYQEKELNYLCNLYIGRLALLGTTLGDQLFDFFTEAREIMKQEKVCEPFEVILSFPTNDEIQAINRSISLLKKEYQKATMALS